MIIVSASGMATGGRVLHHLERKLPDPDTIVLFAGFQAQGTRGRLLEDGAASIKIHGADVPVHAQVKRLEGFSAHADQKEIMRWLAGFRRAPKKTFIVHGEPESAETLASLMKEQLGWDVEVARDSETRVLFEE